MAFWQDGEFLKEEAEAKRRQWHMKDFPLFSDSSLFQPVEMEGIPRWRVIKWKTVCRPLQRKLHHSFDGSSSVSLTLGLEEAVAALSAGHMGKHPMVSLRMRSSWP